MCTVPQKGANDGHNVRSSPTFRLLLPFHERQKEYQLYFARVQTVVKTSFLNVWCVLWHGLNVLRTATIYIPIVLKGKFTRFQPP